MTDKDLLHDLLTKLNDCDNLTQSLKAFNTKLKVRRAFNQLVRAVTLELVKQAKVLK